MNNVCETVLKNIKKYIFLSFILLSLPACNQGDGVFMYDVEKEKASPRSFENNGFRWNVPPSWVYKTPVTPFQDALFFAADHQDPFLENDYTTATVSISFIEGSENDLASNVLRWKKQLNENFEQVYVQQVDIETNLGIWRLIKLSEKDKAIFVGIWNDYEGSLFLKIQGPLNTLNQHADAFIQLIESVERKND
jgi:hypothetical protein